MLAGLAAFGFPCPRKLPSNLVAVLGSKFKNWVPQRHRGYCKRTGAGVLTVLVASLSVALVIRELRCAHLVRSRAPLVCSDISTKILVQKRSGGRVKMSHIPLVFSSLCIRVTSFSLLLPVFPSSDVSAPRRIRMVNDISPRRHQSEPEVHLRKRHPTWGDPPVTGTPLAVLCPLEGGVRRT